MCENKGTPTDVVQEKHTRVEPRRIPYHKAKALNTNREPRHTQTNWQKILAFIRMRVRAMLSFVYAFLHEKGEGRGGFLRVCREKRGFIPHPPMESPMQVFARRGERKK